MKGKTEYRSLTVQADGNNEDSLHVEGYAVVFNEETVLWRSRWSGIEYREVIESGAIDAATDMSDVVMYYNHSDVAYILARTQNNTLQLQVDERGLKISADIAPTTCGKDIYQLIKRGDISKMSFAFSVDKEAEEEDRNAKTSTRRVQHIGTIVDVSPVDMPAYDGTIIVARSQTEEIEALKQAEERLKQELIVKTYL